MSSDHAHVALDARAAPRHLSFTPSIRVLGKKNKFGGGFRVAAPCATVRREGFDNPVPCRAVARQVHLASTMNLLFSVRKCLPEEV